MDSILTFNLVIFLHDVNNLDKDLNTITTYFILPDSTKTGTFYQF